jgi:hypothetical protein
MRWQVAARIASLIPILYGNLFRPVLGSAYDRLEQQAWVFLAKEAQKLARTCDLPARNAGELATTLGIITTVFFGPELKSEEAIFEGDRAVLIVRRCPFQVREQELQSGHGVIFNRCLAFSISTVEALNPGYTLRFVRSTCLGDRHCEMKIARKEVIEKEEKE